MNAALVPGSMSKPPVRSVLRPRLPTVVGEPVFGGHVAETANGHRIEVHAVGGPERRRLRRPDLRHQTRRRVDRHQTEHVAVDRDGIERAGRWAEVDTRQEFARAESGERHVVDEIARRVAEEAHQMFVACAYP